MTEYYNPNKILNMKDLDGDEPSIYMVTNNRSAGKTTAFLKLSLEHFKKTGRKTILLYRYQYELSSAYQIYKGALELFKNLGTDVKTLPHARGLFYEIFLISCFITYVIIY